MLYLEQDLDTLWLAGDGGQVQGGASWKEEEEKRQVGGPMLANDSLGGKARDAQIIKGRLEREALSHVGPEIPVPQVSGTLDGGGRGVKYTQFAGRGTTGGCWPDFMRKEAGGCGEDLQQGPHGPPLLL